MEEDPLEVTRPCLYGIGPAAGDSCKWRTETFRPFRPLVTEMQGLRTTSSKDKSLRTLAIT